MQHILDAQESFSKVMGVANDDSLSTHPASMRPHAPVHVEKRSEFRTDVFDLAGLVAALGLDRVAVHGVGNPEHLPVGGSKGKRGWSPY